MNKILVALILLISCKTNNIEIESDASKSNKIIVETIIDRKIEISEICPSVSYVKLESRPDNTFGSIDKLIIHDNKFYVLDSKTLRILVFDINGNFIFQLSKHGRGPGEYLNLEDFLVDSSSNKIEILDDANQKALVYDINGEYISERKYQFFADQFCKLSKDIYLYFFNNYPNNADVKESYNVLILDSSFQVKNSFLPIGELAGLKIGEQNCLQKYVNGVNVTIPLDNRIYFVTANNYSVKYEIQFVNFSIPENFLKEYFEKANIDRNSRTMALIQFIHRINEGDYIINMSNVFENSKYLTFQYRISDKGTFTVFWNKSTRETHIGLAENDIDLGLFGTPLFILKDTLYTYFQAYELKEKLKNIDTRSLPRNAEYIRLIRFSESIMDNDNPIIAKFCLK